MSTSIRASLRAFAVAHVRKRGPLCSVCRLPKDVWAAARDEHVEHGTSWPVLSEGLRGIGHVVAASTLAKHFREGHDKREG